MLKNKLRIIGIIAVCSTIYAVSNKDNVAMAATTVIDKTSITGNSSVSWPTTFYPYKKNDGTNIYDPFENYNPGTDIVSDTTNVNNVAGNLPSVYVTSDGTTLFFRLRLDSDPRNLTAGGFRSSAWLLDIAAATENIDQSNPNYGKYTHRVSIGIDGKSPSEDYVYITDYQGNYVYKLYKTVGTTGNQSVPGTRVTPTGDGTSSYFLDIQIPINLITDLEQNQLGLSDPINSSRAVKLYFGTSQAANLAVINKDYD